MSQYGNGGYGQNPFDDRGNEYGGQQGGYSTAPYGQGGYGGGGNGYGQQGGYGGRKSEPRHCAGSGPGGVRKQHVVLECLGHYTSARPDVEDNRLTGIRHGRIGLGDAEYERRTSERSQRRFERVP